jgi:hypothetical protein
MKNFCILLSVCISTIFITSCTKKKQTQSHTPPKVEITDANFKAYLLGNFDTDGDGKLSEAEILQVKQIDCSGKEIADLTGIEKFTNLESLDCHDNRLTELELRYNKKLNKLVCTGNEAPLTIYIGMSSPLRNPQVQVPAAGEPPSTSSMTMPLDVSKCTFDHDKTNIMLMFED